MLQAGITTQIHDEGFKVSPIPEVPGAFVVFEGGDEVLSKKGNRGGITFVTPKFSFFETALRTRASPFIYRCPARAAFFGGPGGTVPTGMGQSEIPLIGF